MSDLCEGSDMSHAMGYQLWSVLLDKRGQDLPDQNKDYMGQVTKLWRSCYLVLLSIDSKTR